MQKKILITGCAGFIGSNLVDYLLKTTNRKIIGIDNFSTGLSKFIPSHERFQFSRFDIADRTNLEKLEILMSQCDTVYHLAANADVRYGLTHPTKDIEQNIVATLNTLIAAQASGTVKYFLFSSTGSVYGEATTFPTPETENFPIQTSLYGTSKIAAEGLISSFSEAYGIKSIIFRFVSIVGERYTHGHIFDFYKQMKIEKRPSLTILGDGAQNKSYLYVGDCVGGMVEIFEKTKDIPTKHNVSIYNLGSENSITVRDSAALIADYLNYDGFFEYTCGNKGWVGDNPIILLDTTKARKTGWRPNLTIHGGIRKTVEWLQQNEWIYDTKK